MNVSVDGKTIRFKTESDALFNSEKSGAKPNTVRIIDAYDRDRIQEKLPEKIIVQHQQEIFMRTITHVYVSEQILGKYLAVFSWTNEKHHHPLEADLTDNDPEAHIMCPDQEPQIDTTQSTILLPRTQIHELIHLAGDRPLPELIASMLKAYTVPPHCHPPAWTLGDEYNKPEQETTDHDAHNIDTELIKQTFLLTKEQSVQVLEMLSPGSPLNRIIQQMHNVELDKKKEQEET